MQKDRYFFYLTLSKYLNLLELAVLNPQAYSNNLKTLDFKTTLMFFTVNLSIWWILFSLIKTFFLQQSHLFFSILSETLILLIPLTAFVSIFALLLHIFAKLFHSRSKVKNNIKAVFFSTILIPFFAVPVFKVLAFIMSLFILIFCFKAVNRFDKLKSFLSVVIPVSIIIIGLYAVGIININLIIR